jgi:hypothetical protein
MDLMSKRLDDHFDDRSAYSCPAFSANFASSAISAPSTRSARATTKKLSNRQKAALKSRLDRFCCLAPFRADDFASKDELTAHQQKNHPETQTLNYCTFCNPSFGDQTSWRDHERIVHRGEVSFVLSWSI